MTPAALDGLLWDARWEGAHGIGRFSREVRTRLGVPPLALGPGSPTSPAGVLALERAAVRERRRVPHRALVCPGFMAPLAWPAPTVVVVHDLMHRDVPGEAGRLRRLYLDTVVRRAVRSAEVVLTVSEHSRARIVEWAGVPEDDVVTVGNGVSAAFTPDGPRRASSGRYVLCVGNRKPHKNLPRLFAAVARLDPDVRLVLSGAPDDVARALALEHGLTDRLGHLGATTDTELAAAYRGAAVTVVPSTHEGFGFAALEAMACGSPVVAGDVTSLPEVVGDAGVLVDPTSVEAIAEGLRSVLADDDLARRLALLGPAQAAHFTWDEVARRTSAVLSERLRVTITASDAPGDGRAHP